MDKPSLQPLSSTPATRGFSLVEVAMSIGIIAFAFVALFALIPTGLTTFRESIDTSNETWILQGMNSMVQTTDFRQVPELDYGTSKEIYYFDEEGKRTDTENYPASDENVKRDRLYAVKLLVEDFVPPGEDGAKENTHGKRVIAVFAPYQNPTAMKDFASVSGADALANLPPNTAVRARSFIAARMDSELD
jgi:uncharacterized protein (TIGR02598 family)